MDERDLWHASAPDTDSKWAFRAMLASLVPCLGPIPAIGLLIPAIRDLRRGTTGRGLVAVAITLTVVQLAALAGIYVLIPKMELARDSDGTANKSGMTSFIHLKVGDCLGDSPAETEEGTQMNFFLVVPCTASHTSQVYARPVIGDVTKEFPGDEAIQAIAEEKCNQEADKLRPRPLIKAEAGIGYSVMLGGWVGNADAVCTLETEPRTDSLLDLAQR